MAQNIEIANAQYNDVPSIEVPTQGGGTASFVDTTDSDAIADDITVGKTAYVNGVKLTGTRSGGGGSYTAGDGIDITNDTISLDVASANDIGGVKVGSGLSIDANGVLSAIGGGITCTTLFNDANGYYNVGNFSLDDDWNKYDLITVEVWDGTNADGKNQLVYTEEFWESCYTDDKYIMATRSGSSFVYFKPITNYKTISFAGRGGNCRLYKILGYKIGGSSLASQIASLEARIQALESQLS